MKQYRDGMMPEQFVTKVVGVSFVGSYPSNIFALAKDTAVTESPLVLVRDPNNEHDANAIRVEASSGVIGHLPRLISLILAPKIDAGEKWSASVHSIVTSSEDMNKPGIKIQVWRTHNENG